MTLSARAQVLFTPEAYGPAGGAGAERLLVW